MSETDEKNQSPSAQIPCENASDAWHAANPEPVCKAMDKTGGDATWVDDGKPCRLIYRPGEWSKEHWHRIGGREPFWHDTIFNTIDNHTARCINQDALREGLEAMGICIETDFNGKSGCIPSYTVRKELRNEDSYFEGDGGCESLTTKGWVNLEKAHGLEGLSQSIYLLHIPTQIEALVCAVEALPVSENEGEKE